MRKRGRSDPAARLCRPAGAKRQLGSPIRGAERPQSNPTAEQASREGALCSPQPQEHSEQLRRTGGTPGGAEEAQGTRYRAPQSNQLGPSRRAEKPMPGGLGDPELGPPGSKSNSRGHPRREF
ncbi:hypothetical protein NDU88_007260 [Pleurodeles waltl]|uniref:Uncharacterized protein n=1 Tax=Pleurodeles waltl TaxID=8319 RepID=A0AAV7PKT8_PLEWA|nr:hypothetical protein NDU88_007260 [Pleurodeles waltl]